MRLFFNVFSLSSEIWDFEVWFPHSKCINQSSILTFVNNGNICRCCLREWNLAELLSPHWSGKCMRPKVFFFYQFWWESVVCFNSTLSHMKLLAFPFHFLNASNTTSYYEVLITFYYQQLIWSISLSDMIDIA